MHEIKSKVLNALRWMAVARFSAQVLTWGITLVVIRLLEPKDYGLVAMAEVFFVVLMTLSSTGFGAALIQSNELNLQQVRQIFGLIIVANGTFSAALFLGAPFIGAYYGKPEVEDICRMLSMGFLLVPFITVPSALLSREIDFRRKSIVDFLASVISAVVILLFAWAGAGFWSLVYGKLLNLLLQAIGLNIVRPYLERPSFALKDAGRLVEFGGIYTATSLIWLIYIQSDIAIAGRSFSAQQLGYYAVGLQLASLASDKLMPILNQVALPAYSRLQSDPVAIGRYFLKVSRIVALALFPVFFGLASVAPEFVRVVLGERYEGAIIPLALMCVLMPLRTTGGLFPAAVYGVGKPKVEFGNKLLGLIVLPTAFFIGVRWGILGLCVGWMVGFSIVFAFQCWRSCRAIETRPEEVALAIAPALLASGVMALAVLATKQVDLSLRFGPAGELACLVLVGVIVYCAVVFMFFRHRVTEAWHAMRTEA